MADSFSPSLSPSPFIPARPVKNAFFTRRRASGNAKTKLASATMESETHEREGGRMRESITSVLGTKVKSTITLITSKLTNYLLRVSAVRPKAIKQVFHA